MLRKRRKNIKFNLKLPQLLRGFSCFRGHIFDKNLKGFSRWTFSGSQQGSDTGKSFMSVVFVSIYRRVPFPWVVVLFLKIISWSPRAEWEISEESCHALLLAHLTVQTLLSSFICAVKLYYVILTSANCLPQCQVNDTTITFFSHSYVN